LIWHNAIATKDNIEKRHWHVDFKCRFCDELETIHHLFFTCSSAKYMWSVMSPTIGANTRPGNLTQYFRLIDVVFPRKTNLHVVGLATLYWAL
jgi:hypothetical protein